jgi:hypothetical protein
LVNGENYGWQVGYASKHYIEMSPRFYFRCVEHTWMVLTSLYFLSLPILFILLSCSSGYLSLSLAFSPFFLLFYYL